MTQGSRRREAHSHGVQSANTCPAVWHFLLR
uniref:Uncharacterized protein n=1 Tax=Anguilla anguilla TaxID=7936 RepID=A0A0E9R0V9_ANGAN